jgi:hypothetical protein
MPFVFGIIGIVLIISGVRGTVVGSNPSLVSLVKSDLTGQPNYTEWMLAIFIIGAIGYIDELKTISRLFMALVVIGLLWSNKGFFSQLTSESSSSDTTIAEPSQQTGSSVVSNMQNEQQQILSNLPNLTSVIPSL